MFGHNNEVMCMAISPNGTFIASASKARDAGTAQVLLWGRGSTQGQGNGATASGVMQLLSKLPGHESTAVCLEFSPDNRWVTDDFLFVFCYIQILLIPVLTAFLCLWVLDSSQVLARIVPCACTRTIPSPTRLRPS